MSTFFEYVLSTLLLLTDSGCFQPDVSSKEGGPGELGNWGTGDLGLSGLVQRF